MRNRVGVIQKLHFLKFMKTEKEKYFDRIKIAMDRGLRKVYFTATGVIPLDASEEDVYAELNRLHDAADQADPEVLGRYSPK